MTKTPTVSPLQERLVLAIEADSPGSPDDIGAAVAAGADVNQPLPNSATPLMWAIAHNKPGAVRRLLAAGADVHACDSDGDTPAVIAARFAPEDDLSILEAVLKAGANPNARGSDRDPAIIFLMRARNLAGILLMARHGADLNALTRTKTPLIIAAASWADWDVVYTLIEGGADALVKDGKIDVAKLVSDHRVTPPDSPLWSWKVKVWNHLAARGAQVAPLPDAS